MLRDYRTQMRDLKAEAKEGPRGDTENVDPGQVGGAGAGARGGRACEWPFVVVVVSRHDGGGLGVTLFFFCRR